MKFLGLAGTHGSGKTSLCEAYVAKNPGSSFIKTGISDIYKALNLDPKVRMTLEQRMEVQEKVLNVLCDQWEQGLLAHKGDGNCISDRTPYDLIAYTLAEVSGYDDISDELSTRIVSYITLCRLAAQAFDGFVHVPIALPMVADPTGKVRAASSLAYRVHLDMLMTKAIEDGGHTPYRIHGIDMAERVKSVERIFEGVESIPI
ncbi:putative thymidylate kinase [Pseudomonas phage nickie]|uniref:Putative thymidylate kinase n=1 Tax=Pseudomonas phage nickie TaxID=2048977 RepID=A0A2H4P766_9CAUD|nr:putative thymidylate kinase [Pseudomonas phage nickie]ATW58022.1 putative thymidylate kinase [Pseudomonas phage nickie]